MSIQGLSSFTGMSEVELAKRAQELVSSGKVQALSLLDAQLLASMGAGNLSAQDQISAAAAQTQQPHVLEEPAITMTRTSTTGGFATAQAQATPDLAAANSPAQLDKAAQAAGTKMTGFAKEQTSLMDSLHNSQQDILKMLNTDDGTSRDVKMEMIKTKMQQMTQMFTLISNVLSNVHDTQKTAIGNLRA
jgi:hypothetical protein